MKRSLVQHQIKNTYISEFHSFICENEEICDPHFHKNFEIIVVIKGECQISVANKSYRLKQGQAAFIMPFQIHSFQIERGASLRCTTLREALILTLSRVLDGNIPQTPIFTPSPETFDYFCRQSLMLFGRDSGMQKRISPPAKRIKTKGILYSIESEFLEQASFSKTRDTEKIVTRVLEYVAENFRNNISLRDIAVSTGYNYQYLSRTFNYTMGMKFKKLLNEYRLEHALYILYDTDRPITEIAFKSGFQSVRSFNKVCLEVFGCSPTELRKRDEKINKMG